MHVASLTADNSSIGKYRTGKERIQLLYGMLFRISLAALAVVLALAACEQATPKDDREPDTAPKFTGEVADQTFKALQAIAPLTLPRARGGNGDPSYRLEGELPHGLEFDRRSRTLSGTPSLVGSNEERTYPLTYRVDDADDNRSSRDADTQRFTITIQPDTVLEKVVSSVAVGAADGGLKYAALPTPSGGPAVSVDGSSTIIAGGAFFLDVVPASGAALDTLLVSVAGESSGYYEVDLEATASSYRLVGLVPHDLDQTRSSLELCVTAVYAIDRAGAAACHSLTIADVSPGDVQVTLSWDADSDVDLEVLGPAGMLLDRGTVTRGADRVTDANANCDAANDTGSDDLRNEYVAWTGTAAPGTYTVQVNYRTSCGVPETDYVLRVSRGGTVGEVSGTLVVPGRLVLDDATFTIAGGTAPPVIEDGISLTYRGSGDQVFPLNSEGQILDATPVTLNLGGADAEVYLVATNTGFHPMAPRVERLDGVSAAAHGSTQAAARAAQRRLAARGAAVPARAWVTTFNNESPLPRAGSCAVQQSRSTNTQVGDKHTFRDFDAAADASVNIPATVRKVAEDSNTRLTVWVANRDWETCTDCVQQQMVDAIADRLLDPDQINDVYHLVRAIFGEPWGPHERPCLIAPGSADDLHILLYDIDGDGVPTVPDEPRTLGFFAAKDLYLRNGADPVIDSSNERLLFYLDAPLLARADGPTWEESDLWPRRMVATLAHELQHMIHFFQKRVSQGAASEAWLNEMASTVAEDLIVGKLVPPIEGVDGPRGVVHSEPTAGAYPNLNGLLPLYNLHNDIRVTAWHGDPSNAAINYALGAYLVRTYGAVLFGAIVQSEHTGAVAIERTLESQGHQVSFGDVLANWAVANLLSDNTDPDDRYQYNSDTWFPSTVGGVTFLLGSINLYHYRYAAGGVEQEGPFLYSLNGFNERTQPPHSNMYAALGSDTGTVRLRVDAVRDNRITIVVKEASE